LRAGDLGAVQPAGDAHLDAAGAEAQRRFDRLAHRAAEGDAFLELHGDRLGNQLRVELRLLDLLDVDEDLAAGALLDFLLQLVDFRSLAADDDAGPRGVDVDLQPVDGALGLDLRHAGMREALLEGLAQIEILVQQLGVVAVRVPARPPRFVEPEPEPERVNLLAHSYSFASFAGLAGFAAARARFFGAAASPPVLPTATIFSGRSLTCTVSCADRVRTR